MSVEKQKTGFNVPSGTTCFYFVYSLTGKMTTMADIATDIKSLWDKFTFNEFIFPTPFLESFSLLMGLNLRQNCFRFWLLLFLVLHRRPVKIFWL